MHFLSELILLNYLKFCQEFLELILQCLSLCHVWLHYLMSG
jgi:hypothetical protein